MFRAALVLASFPLALGACAVKPPVSAAPTPAEVPLVQVATFKEWHGIATPADQSLVAALPQRWARAVGTVPRAAAPKLRAEGPLVRPGAALDMPTPPPGPYFCRLLRFGGRAGVTTFKPDFCYIDSDEGRLSFTKQTGSNLPQGWLYEDTETRRVFLGTMGPGRYGDDPRQDVAGVVERVSPFRWRLVLTRAGRGSTLDMYELVPVTPEVPGAPRAVPAKE